MRFKIDCVSLIVGKKFTDFAFFRFVFEGNFQVQAPRGGLYSEGRFNGEFFALRVWGAYIWRGLFSQLYGILLGTRSLVGTPSGVSKFDFSDNFVSKNLAQIHNFTCWHSKETNLVDCSVLCVERNSERVLL